MEGLKYLEREPIFPIPSVPMSTFDGEAVPSRTVFVAPVVDIVGPEMRNELHARTVLASLGITPFTKESVAIYKRWYAKKHTGVSATIKLFLSMTFIVTMVNFVLTWSVFSGVAAATSMMINIVALIGSLTCTFLLGIIAWAQSRSTVAWSETDLDIFEEIGRVPQFVLDQVAKITQHLPKVTFRVHYAHQDPFLFMHYEGESYPIFVWDERGFVV